MVVYVYDDKSDKTVPVEIDDEILLTEKERDFVFDDEVRKLWHADEEEWYFSIVDVCSVLVGTDNPKRYWSDLKIKLKDEGATETYEKIVRFKLKAADGKMRRTDCANSQHLLRIIQSIPSKKAEPFKLWLAQVGKERLDEMADPQISIDRAIDIYRKKGYSESWITQRLKSIEIRKDMTAEWNRAGVTESKDYATLTNILTKTWSGKTVQQYKEYKNLKKENLRDNMTNTELVLNALAEISTTEISKSTNPEGIDEAKDVTVQGGNIAKIAREALEKQIGHSVISSVNANTPKLLDDDK
ncbi:MAG: Bro-N domain-containing protein [Lachnospiraceae bacterium]|nr:Bro-N domain-containing protein [Lachnospiraceae bacterium]